jgi:hypothetical protein
MLRSAKRITVATLATLSLLGAPATALAANQTQDGLVNVQIGDITLQDIDVGVAAGIAATVCGVDVGPVIVLANQVDATSRKATICKTDSGPVRLRQN